MRLYQVHKNRGGKINIVDGVEKCGGRLVAPAHLRLDSGVPYHVSSAYTLLVARDDYQYRDRASNGKRLNFKFINAKQENYDFTCLP